MGAAPFYTLQELQAAQADPGPQYDTAPSGPPAPPLDTSHFSVLPGTGLDENLGAGIPDYTPQPDTASPSSMPSSSMPSLGDLNATLADASGEPDIQAKLQKYVSAMTAFHAPELKEKLPESSRPGLLANILSFGLAGLNEEQYRQGYNSAVEKHNAAIHLKAVEDARALMQADSHAQLANANLALRVQQLQLQALTQQSVEGQRQLSNLTAQLRIRAFGTLPHPPTETDVAGAEEQGMSYVPAPGLPGHFMLIPRQYANTGGTGGVGGVGEPPPSSPAPPAPGSPLGDALGVSALGAGTPAASGGNGGGFAGLAARKAEAAAQAKARSQQLVSDAKLTPRLDRLYREFNVLRTNVATVLPLMGSNPLSTFGRGQIGGRASLFSAARSQDPKVRAAAQSMMNSGRSIFSMIFGEAGGTEGIRVTMPEITMFRQPLEGIIKGHTTIEEAQSTIDDVVRYLKENDPRTAQPTTATPGTTTPPPTTGGRNPRDSFNSLLEQYGH